MPDDLELLRAYLERGSEESFRLLVERHGGMVHAVAMRILQNPALAEEAAQAAFILLARKGAGLRAGTVVPGWLYRTVRFVSLAALRQEQRRATQQQDLAKMNEPGAAAWRQIEPLLDEAVNRLEEKDRHLVVLRFLEGCSFAETGAALGISEAAAKMRATRALDKLRDWLAREGVAVQPGSLAATLAVNGIAGLTPELSQSIAAIALNPGASPSSTLPGLVQAGSGALNWYRTKAALWLAGVVTLVLTGAFGAYEWLKPKPAIGSFQAVAGTWEGTSVTTGNAAPGRQDDAILIIQTTDQGRACSVQMRVPDEGGDSTNVFRFEHRLNGAGTRVITVDDPRIGLFDGEAVVTASSTAGGVWQARFQSRSPDNRRLTECEWSLADGALRIWRHDRFPGPQGSLDMFTEVKLRRRLPAP